MTREPTQQVLGDKHVGLLTLGWGGQAEEVVTGRINFWSVVLCNLNTFVLSDKHNQVTVCRDWSVKEK